MAGSFSHVGLGRGPDVDHLGAYPFGFEPLRRGERLVEHRPPPDDRDVLSFLEDSGFADRHRVVVVRHLLDERPVVSGLLEKDDRVRVTDRGEEEPLGIVRR